MTHRIAFSVLALLASCLTGCAERLMRETMGAAMGAEPKVVAYNLTDGPADLSSYQGIRLGEVTMAPGLAAPGTLPEVVQKDWAGALAKRPAAAEGAPTAVLNATVLHFEGTNLLDQTTGPFAQLIVRAELADAASGQPLAAANLVGRATSTAAGSPEGLARGTTKALARWLGGHGLTLPGVIDLQQATDVISTPSKLVTPAPAPTPEPVTIRALPPPAPTTPPPPPAPE